MTRSDFAYVILKTALFFTGLIWCAVFWSAFAAWMWATAPQVDITTVAEWLAPTTALTLEDGIRLIEEAR